MENIRGGNMSTFKKNPREYLEKTFQKFESSHRYFGEIYKADEMNMKVSGKSFPSIMENFTKRNI